MQRLTDLEEGVVVPVFAVFGDGVDLLRDLVHDVVQTVKRNLKVDWTEPHREDVKASVRAAVRQVLTRRGVRPEHFDDLVAAVMQQAQASYANWPLAA
jgi:type I restriction enzyme R subunit